MCGALLIYIVQVNINVANARVIDGNKLIEIGNFITYHLCSWQKIHWGAHSIYYKICIEKQRNATPNLNNGVGRCVTSSRVYYGLDKHLGLKDITMKILGHA